MATLTQAETTLAPRQPAPRRIFPRGLWAWLGLLPFILFIAAFQLFPGLSILVRSFQTTSGSFTFQNILDLNQEIVRNAYWQTLRLSFISAVTGSVVGFMLAWSVTLGGLPRWIRQPVLSFSGVAANFAGVPLVFAFITVFGNTGLLTGRRGVITQALNSVGISLYPGFNLYSFWGLVAVYLFFQIPLMVLVMVPALDGLRKEWREASENLGATRFQYWRFVAAPILMPSFIGTLALLFANAFGTHATAFALVGGGAGQNMIITIMVGNQFSTDAFSNPGLGYALSLGMIVVMAVTILIYSHFRRLSEQWLR
jgi:putative spermidine/putrescine transport system permease protein